jgi:hypothetical protein
MSPQLKSFFLSLSHLQSMVHSSLSRFTENVTLSKREPLIFASSPGSQQGSGQERGKVLDSLEQGHEAVFLAVLVQAGDESCGPRPARRRRNARKHASSSTSFCTACKSPASSSAPVFVKYPVVIAGLWSHFVVDGFKWWAWKLGSVSIIDSFLLSISMKVFVNRTRAVVWQWTFLLGKIIAELNGRFCLDYYFRWDLSLLIMVSQSEYRFHFRSVQCFTVAAVISKFQSLQNVRLRGRFQRRWRRRLRSCEYPCSELKPWIGRFFFVSTHFWKSWVRSPFSAF